MNDSLIRAEDSLLIVIDVQDHFLKKLTSTQSQKLLDRIVWLVGVANWLRIPVVVTAEDQQKQKSETAALQTALSSHTPVLNKMVFGLADQPDILMIVGGTNRKTAVLVGLETDVCIAHSALGLADRGYRVIVLSDATCSPKSGHEAGLARLRDAGVLITTVKGLFYEWMRTVERVHRFEAECPDLAFPKDLDL